MADLHENPTVTEGHRKQLRFAHGLARCSQILLQAAENEEEQARILRDALEQVRQATRTSRAFLYRNFNDPELGLCSSGVTVAYDPEFPPETTIPWLVHKIPWSVAPEEARRSLEGGKPFGGPVDVAFATTPDFLRTLQDDGVLSVQFFPIHVGEDWWGYVGFDEREHPRQWQPSETVLLGAVAEMFANALQRWQHEAEMDRRGRYEEALARCSRVLHQVASSSAEQIALLTQALEHLRQAVSADRVYLFENFEDPELGFCLGMRAEACAPGVPAQIGNPSNRRMPWVNLPAEMRQALEAGEPFGGPVDRAFAASPEWIRIFKEQKSPLLSIQQFPIHFGEHWWGFVGFDDVKGPREWDAAEIRILRVAAEMLGNTLRRWQTEAALRAEVEERRRREERLRLLESVVVNTAEGVLITAGEPIDPPGPQILYVNEAFTRMTGYEAEEIVGKDPRVLQGPRTSRRELDRLRTALERCETVEVELINYRKDGSEFWVEMSIVPVFDGKDACTHFVAVQRDITVRRQAETALEVAKEELEARVAGRTREILRANQQLHQEIISRREAEAEVRQRLAIEQKLADLSVRAVTERDFRNILPGLLQDVGTMVGARRVALLFLEDGWEALTEIYEWCAPGTATLDRAWLAPVLPTLLWLREQLEDNQSVFVESLEQVPSTARAERAIFQELGTESLAAFPLQVDGELAAVLVSSNFAREDGALREQLDTFKVIVGLLASVLQREELLDSLEQRAIDRTRELATFYDMTMLASEAESLSDILEPALIQIMEAIRCQAISVHQLSADRNSLRLVAQYGLGWGEDASIQALPDSLREWLADLNEPIISHSGSEAAWPAVGFPGARFPVVIGAQLRARGEALGILSCYRAVDRPYSLNTTALVVALAEQLGIIVENYRLRQQAEEGAIIEERQRLARDLHDAITQSLYSVTLFARSGADALAEGELEKAAEMVAEVETNALRTLKEMRLLLHQLQPLALEQGGLEQAIENRFNQVERRLGIEATLVIGTGRQLRPRAEQSLYRIITEALNNSLRHASASQVNVVLREEPSSIRLEVEDNGRGFDMARPRVGLGITNIEQRVALLQRELQIVSTPGEGTTIAVDLPREWLE